MPRWVWVCLFFAVIAGLAKPAVRADLAKHNPSSQFRAAESNDRLIVEWSGERGLPLRIAFDLADSERLIAELSIAGRIILKDAAPAYWVYVGQRHGSWEDNYFDNPSSRPHEISSYSGKLLMKECRVEDRGERLLVTFTGFSMGVFQGDIVFTLYAGSNLVKQEAVVATQEPSVAYYYDASLTHCSTSQLSRLLWLSADDRFEKHVLVSDIDLDAPHLKVHRRMLVAEGPGGSLAVFPPPHQYFFARDETINYGNLWYRLYSINAKPQLGDLFSFGIRQTPYSEEANKAPLVNAPPGTEQHMSMFWYVGPGSARETFDRVSAYTHNDTFPALPGRKTFTSHYHLAAVMDWVGQNRGAYTPDWVTMFKNMGVNIAHLMDFHTDGHARDLGQLRLTELRDYFDLTRQLSGPDFLVIPGEELWEYFGGHWAVLFPKPVYYYLRRNADQPFEQSIPPFGNVYRIGSAEDMLTMLHREGGLAWQTHPRTKGSAGFPDANKDQFFTRDASWLGGGFKAMPSDYSSPRLGERALNLLDDMNNWGQRKFLIGEVDVFKINHTHELYGHMNINYVKLDKTPGPSDWSALNRALSRGDFFTTTGEVLIHEFGVQLSNSKISAEADVEWTFPLNFVELVWGDGTKTFRSIVAANETKEFGRQRFSIAENAPGAKWARFAAWDIAADGALTQPIRFDNAQ
jgi:hypothetical protein